MTAIDCIHIRELLLVPSPLRVLIGRRRYSRSCMQLMNTLFRAEILETYGLFAYHR